jgi:hypothetical protein
MRVKPQKLRNNQMSSKLLSSKKSKVVTVLVGSALVLAGVGVSGAYLSAQETLQVKANVTTLGILVNGVPVNAAPLTINDIAPGVNGEGHGSFTVGNTSPTLAGTITIGAPIHVNSIHGNANLLAQNAKEIRNDLTYRVTGTNGFDSGWKSVTDTSAVNSDGQISLGDIPANTTATYYVDVKLADTAGNDWQGASVDGTVTVVNTQKH